MYSTSKLIQDYKDDFTAKTGKYIKVFTCPKLESQMHLSENPNMYAIALIICRYTGWNWQTILTSSIRNHEIILSRQIIAAILRYNNCKLIAIGKFLHKDHHTIISQLQAFENHYSTELTFKQLYEEIVINLSEHYHDHEDITQEQFKQLINDDTI
jgi:chromosomal replication initiation ATPase DnaA